MDLYIHILEKKKSVYMMYSTKRAVKQGKRANALYV